MTKGNQVTIYENWMKADKVEGIATLVCLVGREDFHLDGQAQQAETWLVCFDGDTWEDTFQRTILV